MVTIDSNDCPTGYIAESLNISADPSIVPGESVIAALQEFADDPIRQAKTVIEVPVALIHVGEEPDTDP